jgi:hypothetical protein
MLNSARNCTLKRSLMGNARTIDRSVFHIPGFLRMLRPEFPKLTVVTGAKAAGL